MRKEVFLTLAALGLGACQFSAPYYNEANFAAPAAPTRLNFDEAKAVCRSRTLQHHWMGDTNDLDIPRYTACMASEGYAFSGTAKQ